MRRGYVDYGSGHVAQPRGNSGQMIINMKTTVTTSGGQHNGLVVHSAIQSAGHNNGGGAWISSPYSDVSRRPEEMTHSNTSLHRHSASPLPIQMVPSTSRETLVSTGKPRDTVSPPPSPIFSFKGRDSPPDEFIQPTKLVLNVFQPKQKEPIWQVPLHQSHQSHQIHPNEQNSSGGIQLSRKDAVLNDQVTTTTTVEVFRAPQDPEYPMISLPRHQQFGGAPLLIRTNGPGYEQWRGQESREVKGVQWKERLIEESDRRYPDNNDYDEIAPVPDAHIIHNDYRPKPAGFSTYSTPFQPVTHPMIMSGSREDLRSQPPPYRAPLSPLYIVPDRHQNRRSIGLSEEQLDNEYNRERYHRRSKSSTRDDRHRNLRHRSQSPASRRSVLGGSQEFVLPLHSPIGSTLMLASPDPNEVPGRPASARSQEIFALYQTRDAHNRIVDRL